MRPRVAGGRPPGVAEGRGGSSQPRSTPGKPSGAAAAGPGPWGRTALEPSFPGPRGAHVAPMWRGGNPVFPLPVPGPGPAVSLLLFSYPKVRVREQVGGLCPQPRGPWALVPMAQPRPPRPLALAEALAQETPSPRVSQRSGSASSSGPCTRRAVGLLVEAKSCSEAGERGRVWAAVMAAGRSPLRLLAGLCCPSPHPGCGPPVIAGLCSVPAAPRSYLCFESSKSGSSKRNKVIRLLDITDIQKVGRAASWPLRPGSRDALGRQGVGVGGRLG